MIAIVSDSKWLFDVLNTLGTKWEVSLVKPYDITTLDNNVGLVVLDECKDVNLAIPFIRGSIPIPTISLGKDNTFDMIKPLRIADFMQLVEYHLRGLYYIIDNQIRFDYQRRVLCDLKKDSTVPLTEKESEILKYLLIKKEGISKTEMLKQIWRYHPDAITTTVEAHIHRLKYKLSCISSLALTVTFANDLYQLYKSTKT